MIVRQSVPWLAAIPIFMVIFTLGSWYAGHSDDLLPHSLESYLKGAQESCVPTPQEIHVAAPLETCVPAPKETVVVEVERPPQKPSLIEAIKRIWESQIIPVDTQAFRALDDEMYTIPADPHWKSGLGSRICLVDVDTRFMNNDGEVWSPNEFHYDSIARASPGFYNHYQYAMIHGYDYKFVHTKGVEGMNVGWHRISVISDLLKSGKYDFVVYTDADVVFPHLNLPFEWLMNRWNITNDDAITMATDVDWPQCKDSHGKIIGNTGFIIAANTPTAIEMLDVWDSCLSETRYEGCGRFIKDWPAEQGAFGEYVRWDYMDSYKEVPCNEALLWPNSGYGCNGVFIRHYTMDKWGPKGVLADTLRDGVLHALKHEMLSHKGDLYVETDLPEPVVEPMVEHVDVPVEEHMDEDKMEDGMDVGHSEGS